MATVEMHALRNAAVVALGFGIAKTVGKLLRRRRRKAQDGQGAWNEVIRTSAAAGLSAELYGRIAELTGSKPLAGLASAVPLRALVDDDSFHFSYRFLAAYISAQTLVAAVPVLKKNPQLSMLLSASQLLSAYILSDDGLPQDYFRFLLSQGKMDKKGLLRIRDIYTSGKLGQSVPHLWAFGTDMSINEKHGTDTWGGFNRCARDWFVQHYRAAVPFYVKIYTLRLIAKLLSRGKGLRRELAAVLAGSPAPQIRGGVSFCTDVLRSALFLSLYCTSAWYSLGAAGKLFPDAKASPLILQALLALPGLTVMVETPAQQHTIANYCATFALYPILSQSTLLFDASLAASVAACGSGAVKTPGLLSLMWPSLDAAKKAAPAN